MTSGEGKVTLSAAVPTELKERFQRIAAEKRWSLSQTLVIFIEEFLPHWENELGMADTEASPTTQTKKKK